MKRKTSIDKPNGQVANEDLSSDDIKNSINEINKHQKVTRESIVSVMGNKIHSPNGNKFYRINLTTL